MCYHFEERSMPLTPDYTKAGINRALAVVLIEHSDIGLVLVYGCEILSILVVGREKKARNIEVP
jgi:hypothetical protein